MYLADYMFTTEAEDMYTGIIGYKTITLPLGHLLLALYKTHNHCYFMHDFFSHLEFNACTIYSFPLINFGIKKQKVNVLEHNCFQEDTVATTIKLIEVSSKQHYQLQHTYVTKRTCIADMIVFNLAFKSLK